LFLFGEGLGAVANYLYWRFQAPSKPMAGYSPLLINDLRSEKWAGTLCPTLYLVDPPFLKFAISESIPSLR
jgi:hypothetical protein